MSEIHIVRDYPQPPAKVWRALTDPALIPRWTSTGAGGRPEGFSTAVGTIDNKETVEVSIDPGQHTLRIRHGRYSSRDRAFDVADGEVAAFRCHGVRYWPVWLASFAKSDLAIVLSSE